jgi:ATP-dependent helicase HrpB
MDPLPIDAHLAEIASRLRERRNLVLVADPGAGKTTRVPPALLSAGLAGAGEIWVVEPRRLAARMAAARVAAEIGEPVGERVGYEVRFDRVFSDRTRIRFMTEGILSRRLVDEPEVPAATVVVLDEFHERHLSADVALALLRRLQRGPRRDLHLLVMSATLEAEPIAAFLESDALRVPGRRFEVATVYEPLPDNRPLAAKVAGAVRRAIVLGPNGDVLVFLPGAAEIRAARLACAELAEEADALLLPLHGDLPPAEQDRAVRRADRRKILLSTNVAETSVTIEGVVAVVDSGLARIARHSPWSGLPALETARVSRASAAQRAGRAGRTQPGHCLRLYTKHDHDTRPAHDTPEIRRGDLAETALMLRAAGVRDLATFGWFEAPPPAALGAADDLLVRLGAVSAEREMTPLGGELLSLPLHPRLGRLVLEARARGAPSRGCLLAALLQERDIRLASRARLGEGPMAALETGPSDLLARMDALAEGVGLDPAAVRMVARSREQIERILGVRRSAERSESEEALLIATLAAFPDRVARRRAARSPEVVFAAGGAGRLSPDSVVRDAELLVAAHAEEGREGVLVRVASAIEPEWLAELFPERLRARRAVRFVPESERVEAVSATTYDGLVLEESRSAEDPAEVAHVLFEAAMAAGPRAFCDVEALERYQARVAFAAAHSPGLPRLDEDALKRGLRALCEGRRSFAELREAGLLRTLEEILGAKERALVERLAPERVELPGGRRARVEYEAGNPPWIASRLQDFFGMKQGPALAGGRVPLVLHLCAPSGRPVQVTTDLAGFWDRHYPSIRRELMRRYPKHAWPEDPRTAAPPKVGPRGR